MKKTQLDEVRAEVRLLELQLQHAALFQDAFSQMDLYKKLQEKKFTLRHFTMDVDNVRTNYSHQTKDTLLLEYKYRVEALQARVMWLEAMLEVSDNNNLK